MVLETPVRALFDEIVKKYWAGWHKLNSTSSRFEQYEIKARVVWEFRKASNGSWVFSEEWQLRHGPVWVGSHAR